MRFERMYGCAVCAPARCVLLKDVDGLYERDPRAGGPAPRRYERVSFAERYPVDIGQGPAPTIHLVNVDGDEIPAQVVENKLCEDCGEYDVDYTMNAGSYYDKVNAPYLMAESVDNFISDSRLDFVDSRYRSVSLADLFPDGYRRWLANTLTDDDSELSVELNFEKLADYRPPEVTRIYANHGTMLTAFF